MHHRQRLPLGLASAALLCAILYACASHANAPLLPAARRPPASISQTSAYDSAILNDSPVRYYKLDETNGPNALESQGTGPDGTYDGPVSYNLAGPLLDEASSSIGLNAGAYDVGVKIPAALTTAGSYSIETWIRPSLNRSYMTVWGSSSSHRLLVSSSGTLLSQFSGSFFSKRALSNNAWHHVVFVYNASTATQAYYIDGTLDSTASLAASAAAFTAPYYLGQYDTSGNYKWHGGMALHAVYSYALSASQVMAHYNAAGYPPASPTPAPTPVATPPPDSPCGGYRWDVKVATDSAASSIAVSPASQETMEWLTGIPQPNPDNALPRMAPVETSTYEIVNATLTEVFLAVDHDYHLKIQDAKGTQMIAESPDPSCAPQSALYSEIAAVHSKIAAQYPGISSTPMTLNQPVTLEGVAFFDYVPNFAPGEALNGIELHPILSICFGTNCALAPPVTPSPSATPSPATTPAPSPSPSPSPSASPTPSQSSPYGSAVLADAPREYYKFNESGGAVANDSSGNALNGNYVGAVTFGAAGPLLDEPSTAISLPGGSASVGASVPNPNAAAGTSYTIEVWVNPAPSTGYMTLWGYSSTHRLLLSPTGQLLSQLSGNFFSGGTLTRNAWHDVAFVYDANSQTAAYYIDGASAGSAAVAISAAAFTAPYYFGQYDSSANYKWNGRIAQAAFYTSALSASQIAAHYAAAGYGASATPSPSPSATPSATPLPSPSPTSSPAPSSTPSPTSSPVSYQNAVLAESPFEYLQLADASGPAAVDSSGNNENGTYIGAVTFGVAGPLQNAPSSAISLAGGTASAGVQAPNPNAFAGTSYSVELWVDPAPSSDYMALWGYNATHRLLLSSSGQLLSQLSGNFFSKGTLARNVWHQVVFVYDASAQTATYYVDGAFDSSAGISNSSAAFTSAYYLGQYSTGTSYKWNGRLGQLGFYLSALTAAQVAQHYSAAGY